MGMDFFWGGRGGGEREKSNKNILKLGCGDGCTTLLIY